MTGSLCFALGYGLVVQPINTKNRRQISFNTEINPSCELQVEFLPEYGRPVRRLKSLKAT